MVLRWPTTLKRGSVLRRLLAASSQQHSIGFLDSYTPHAPSLCDPHRGPQSVGGAGRRYLGAVDYRASAVPRFCRKRGQIAECRDYQRSAEAAERSLPFATDVNKPA